MEKLNTCFIILLLIGLASLDVTAQKGAFDIGVSGGVSIYQGDVSKDGFGTLKGNNWVSGLKTSYVLSDFWALEASFHKGKLGAADSFYIEDPFRAQRQYEFETSFKDIAIKARFFPLGQLKLQPYASLGFGLVIFTPQAYLLNNTHQNLTDFIKQDLEADLPKNAWFVPVEFGLSYSFTDRLSISTGLQLNFSMTDYLDGIHWAGNTSDKDRYGQLYLGTSFRFNGIKDIDKDGIADLEDECPFKPGLRSTHGCPDADRDLIRDSDDRCPYAAGKSDLFGCPDTDNDGTADPYDRCPAKAGPPEALGCPSVDSDYDGIEDHLDECPLVKGPPERNGCPIVDSDLDGIYDEDDECPMLYGLPVFNGCPDTDGDGIEDTRDACPAIFGLFSEKGCPVFKSTEEEAIALSRQKMYFGADDSAITNFALLDQIVAFLKENPSYKLTIQGHADPMGSDKTTDYISELRAEKVKQYIYSKSVVAHRLHAEGLGDRHTISLKPGLMNQTWNRRVEFVLYE